MDVKIAPKVKVNMPPQPKRVVEHSFDFGSAIGAFGQAGEALHEAFEDISSAFDKNTDLDLMPMDNEQAIRRRIEQQFNKRKEFNIHLVSFLMVNALLWVIFGSSGGSDFAWPLIVTLGWASGLAAHAVETYFVTGRRATRRLEAIQGEFYNTFGENWQSADRKELKRIRGRVSQAINKRREFYQHFAVYIFINIMLWYIYAQSTGLPFGIGSALDSIPFPWPILVTLGWGIGLVSHAVDAGSAIMRERAINRAVEREQQRLYAGEKPKRERRRDDSRHVRLTEDGEFTDSMVESFEDDEKPKRGRRRR